MTVLVVALVVALAGCAALLFVRGAETADRRRDHYAEAVAALAALVEYPYRIRRRTDDENATVAALGDRGHDLQERLARHQAWIATENRDVAAAYRQARRAIDALVGPAVEDAWEVEPVSHPAEMNILSDLRTACAKHIADVETAAAIRFRSKSVKTL